MATKIHIQASHYGQELAAYQILESHRNHFSQAGNWVCVYMKLQSFQLGQAVPGSRGRTNLLAPMKGKWLGLPMSTPSLDHKVRVMPCGISVLGRYPSLMGKRPDFKHRDHSPCDQHISKG